MPLEIWLEILKSIKRNVLAKRLSLIGRLVHAAAHIQLHEQGEHVLGNLHFQRRMKRKYLQIDGNSAELFLITKKVPIADYDLPGNIVNFKSIKIGLGYRMISFF